MKWTKEKIIQEVFSLERKLKRRPTKHDHSNLYILSKKHLGSWNSLMKSAGYDIKNHQKPKIPNLNSNSFFYFLGLLCTDGHIVFDKKYKTYKVMLFTSNKNEKDLIIKIIRELFKYKASIRKKKYGFAKKINYEIYISSKSLCKFLINKIKIPSGSKSLTVTIPKFIINNNEEKIWHFIRGVFDGDGTIINTNKAYTLKIYSGSEKFIKNFDKILKSFGFTIGIIKQERKKLWVWKINRRGYIEKFYQLLYKNCNEYCYQRKKLIWEKQYI